MGISELFFPKQYKCIFCGCETGNYAICDKCNASLPYISEPICEKCGGHKSGAGDVCIECKDKNLYYEKCYCVFDYIDDVQSKIIAFKQGGYKHIGETFAYVINDKFQTIDNKIDIIIPIPISKERLKERGFNQSEVLCQELDTKLPISSNLLSRIRNTPHQTGLSKSNRLKNLEGCFEVTNKKAIKGKRILLIDDIYTTGSTLNECAKTLITCGASTVYGLCLARAKYKLDRVIA